MPKKEILRFEEIEDDGLDLVGGKCLALGKMIKGGINCPMGFAITTFGFSAFLEEIGFFRNMKPHLDELVHCDEAKRFDETSSIFRQYIESKELPQHMKQEISSEYHWLCRKYKTDNVEVAVRSSGVAEDMADASFAGQHDTFLGVVGESDLYDKILKCWGSAFTSRAMTYRVRKGIGFERLGIAVAVQKLVRAKCAGVGFTIHPITGNMAQIVIEGNWGLGESVVSGMVSPDEFVVNKKTFLLEDKRINEKLIEIIFDPETKKTVQREIPRERRKLFCLKDEEVQFLAKLGKKLEAYFGCPQDFEWAIDDNINFPDNVFVLQSRPITVKVKYKSPLEKLADMITAHQFGH